MPRGKLPAQLALHSADGAALLTLTTSAPLQLAVWLHGRRVLHGELIGLPAGGDATAPPEWAATDTSRTLRFGCGGARVDVRRARAATFAVEVVGGEATPCVEAALELEEARWFGLGHLMFQHWPLEKGRLELGPFYPFDNGPNGVCTLLEAVVVSTAGAVVVADDESRCLHLGLNGTPDGPEGVPPPHHSKPLKWGTGVANFDRMILPEKDIDGGGDGLLRLQSRAEYDWPHVLHPWLREKGNVSGVKRSCLKVELGATANVRSACDAVLRDLKQRMGGERHTPPPESMMRYPIWSTWARYKDAVTQEDVLEFARDIVGKGLPRSVMGIDDRWSVKYGDLDFDRNKFPDPARMMDELHALGFMVTLWVTPFANMDSQAVLGEESKEYFVRTEDGDVGEFAWWQPTKVAALDVTNLKACDWFVGGLQRMCDEYGLDGFKFDAGEPSFLPKSSSLEATMVAPSEYTRAWIHRVATRFPVSEVRSGVRGCQKAAPMFRLFDKFSTWGLENGLQSVLAGLLTSGILGYPFCIPDYIAGNAYGDETPDAELMVRWAQASSAMPAMQFSIPPWSMGEECERLCESALMWRERFFWKRIEASVEEAAERYVPIARPMWWAEPDGREVPEICDQFMVGDDCVVAPVVVKKQRARRVFLPSGMWRQVLLNDGCRMGTDLHEGPCWLENVPAPLEDMPAFAREIAGGPDV